MTSAMRFEFKVTNNVVEYEALFVGLRLAKKMQVRKLIINSDSQMVVSQVNGTFIARKMSMSSYLKLVMSLLGSFEKFELIQILRDENAHANALSKLANSKDFELLTVISIEHLTMLSTEPPKVMWVEGTPTWIQPIIVHLRDHVPPTNKEEVHKLRRSSAHFLFFDDVLYKRGFSFPLLRCMGGEETNYVLRKG